MTKKQEKERNKKNRVLVPFNTGTRVHKDKKDLLKREDKKFLKKIQKEY